MQLHLLRESYLKITFSTTEKAAPLLLVTISCMENESGFHWICV